MLQKKKIYFTFIFCVSFLSLSLKAQKDVDVLEESTFFTSRESFRKKGQTYTKIYSQISLGLNRSYIESKIFVSPHGLFEYSKPFFSLASKVSSKNRESVLGFSLGARFLHFKKGMFSLFNDLGFLLENKQQESIDRNESLLFLSPKLYIKVTSRFYLVSEFVMSYQIKDNKKQRFFEDFFDKNKIAYSFMYSFVSIL